MNALLKCVLKSLFRTAATFCPEKTKMQVSDARELLKNHSPRPVGTCMTENEIDLSGDYDLQIIIPAYNVEKYIRECLKSVFSQETKYRIIVTIINDGSTDNTEEKIESCVRNYNGSIEVDIISQKNRGLSGARNRGLEVLRARYVLFLDSDDVLPEGAVEKLLNQAYEVSADMIQGGMRTFDESDSVDHKLSKSGLLKDCEGVFDGYVGGKTFRYSVLEHFQFPEGYWFEDTPISFMLMALPYRFAAVDGVTYGYRYNPNGITATAHRSNKCIDTYWITEECLQEFPAFGLDYNQRAYEYLLRQSMMNERRIIHQPRKIRKAVFILTTDLIERYFSEFSTKDAAMVKIEKALRSRQFSKFECLTLGA